MWWRRGCCGAVGGVLRSRTEYWFSRLVNFAVEGERAVGEVEVCDMCTLVHMSTVCAIFLEGLLSIIFRWYTGIPGIYIWFGEFRDTKIYIDKLCRESITELIVLY